MCEGLLLALTTFMCSRIGNDPLNRIDEIKEECYLACSFILFCAISPLRGPKLRTVHQSCARKGSVIYVKFFLPYLEKCSPKSYKVTQVSSHDCLWTHSKRSPLLQTFSSTMSPMALRSFASHLNE